MQIIYDVILKLLTVSEIRMLISGNQDEDQLVVVITMVIINIVVYLTVYQ